MAKAVVKLFNDPAVAVSAIRELQSKGVKASDIGIAAKSDDVSDMIARRAEVPLSGKIEAAGVGSVALAGPAAAVDSLDGLADLLGVPKDAFFYYESGIRRGGVVVCVQIDETKEGDAKAAMREADNFHITPVDPPINDRPFFLSERATKSDARDRLFSGDFRKY